MALLLAALIATVWLLAPSPQAHAYGAVVAVLLGYAILHVALGLLICMFVAQRRRAGYVAAIQGAEPHIARLWADYAIAVGTIALICTHLPGLLT